MRHNRSEYLANLDLNPRGHLRIAQPIRPRKSQARRRRYNAAWARAAAFAAAFLSTGIVIGGF